MARASVPLEQVRELRAASQGFRLLPSKVQQRITKTMRTEYLPMLGREVVAAARSSGAPGGMDVAAASDQRFYTGTNPGIAIGTGKRQFSGGADSAVLIRGAEFGANRTLYSRYPVRTRKGVRTVERRATRQFPKQRTKGWFVWPTLAEVMPKVAAGWIGSVADEIRAAMGAD